MADTTTPAPEDRFKDLTREKSCYGHKSDIEVAGMARMLMRSDLDHEPICVGARDRIMVLHWEARRLREALEQIAAEPLSRCNGYTRCTTHFAPPHLVDIARKALGMEPARRPERD